MTNGITSPEQFFGFQLGSDRNLARWDTIVDYFHRLELESDRIRVVNMGESTEGNPFLLVTISSPENLANLERLREVNLQISDPRGLSREQVAELVNEGKVLICQSMSMHATEVGGTQMAPELAYDLLTDNSEDTLRILDNVVFLMVPCFNPDGQIMVTDWYRQWVDSEYEGSSLPWLYQKYTGHDNNRDAFMLNIAESKHMASILFRDWKPQAYQDHHHMGSYGARLFVAPYSDPIHPYADPLIWRELAWYGGHMAYKLEEAGKQGILNAAQFPGWGHLGFHWITNYHNIAGMLTESASAKLATPLYVDPSQLKGASARTFPEYTAQTNFPNPWPGGWWRLRDIVEQQRISAWALLDIAARYRETVLWNAYQKAQRQTERGESERPFAFVVPRKQHDPLTGLKLVRVLLAQGIEVQEAETSFRTGDRVFPGGTYVVFMQQPKRGLIKTLLERTQHPDNYWTRTPDDDPVVFDTASDTVAEYMGVGVMAIDAPFDGEFSVVTDVEVPSVSVAASPAGYMLDPRLNDTYTAVSRLLQGHVEVARMTEPTNAGGQQLPAGAFYVGGSSSDELAAALGSLGVQALPVDAPPSGGMQPVKSLRVGIYQRYWGGNADEGWTRLVFDRFEFPYRTLRDEDFQGELRDLADVIILPSDMTPMIVGLEQADTDKYPRLARMLQWFGGVESVPPDYRSGIGEEGVEALRRFVEDGGRLVALGQSADLAIDELKLNVENVVADADEFFCHGSTLRAQVDTSDPLGFGMPETALVFNWDSPAFEIRESRHAETYRVIVRYPEQDLLQSGQLVGEKVIANKAAMLAIAKGRGEVVLIGLRVQHRGQMHGTYKLLFNCLF